MYLCISTVVDFNSQNFDPLMIFDKYSSAKKELFPFVTMSFRQFMIETFKTVTNINQNANSLGHKSFDSTARHTRPIVLPVPLK